MIFSSTAFVSLPELELSLPRGHCFSCSPGAAHQDQEAEMLFLGSWYSPRTLLSYGLPSVSQVLLSIFTSLDTPSPCQRSSPLGFQHFLTPHWEKSLYLKLTWSLFCQFLILQHLQLLALGSVMDIIISQIANSDRHSLLAYLTILRPLVTLIQCSPLSINTHCFCFFETIL